MNMPKTITSRASIVITILFATLAGNSAAQNSPCSGETLDPAPGVVLSWPSGAGNGFQLWVDTIASFSGPNSPIFSLSYSSQLSTTLALLYGKHYYWKIAPTFNGSWGAFSSPPCEFFTTSTVVAPTVAPTVYSPTADQADVVSLNMSWAGVGGGSNYDYQYSTSAAFSGATVNNTPTTSSGFIASFAPGSTYYFRVRGKNSAGAGPWSATRTFYTQTVTTPMNLKVFLQGPLVIGTPSLMNDALRTAGWIPANEPYTNLGFYVRGNWNAALTASLATTGANAIVDWVFVELRNGTTNAVVGSYAMLVQRDGDVVMPNSTVPNFPFPMGSIKVAVRHRNHLGAMASTAVSPNGTALTINLTAPATATHGTNARFISGTVAALWSGDANGNGTVAYSGSGNDRDLVLAAIGGVIPTSFLDGYHMVDVSMSGRVLYTGAGNDRDMILFTIGGVIPTATRVQQLP